MDPQLRDRLLLSIEGDHLALLCGAGLSMSPPTNLPCAGALAEQCANRFHFVTGTPLSEEVRRDLERLSEEGKLKPVIQHVYALSEARTAMRHLEDRTVQGKIVLTV